MKTIKETINTLRRLLKYSRSGLIAVLILLPLISSAQNITGVNSVTKDDVETYEYVSNNILLGVGWQAIDGVVQSSSYTSGPGSQSTYSATVKWDQAGVQKLEFSDVAGFIDDHTVTVTYPPLTAGSVGTNQSINCGTSPATLTDTNSPTGGDGSYVYKWQWKSPINTLWNDISGSNSASYSPGTLSEDRHFRRGVTSDGSTEYTGLISIAIIDNLTSGSITGPSLLCYNNTASFTNTTSPTGGDGSYTYQWQSRVSPASWVNISGATSATYTSGQLTSDIEYRRQVTSCFDTKSTSSVSVTVHPDLNPGSIGSNQTICVNTPPALLTNVSSASGGDYYNAPTYQWQSSSEGSGWINISGATGTSFSSGNLSATTYFRRAATSCNTTEYSPMVTITVQQGDDAAGDLDGSYVYTNSATGTLTLSNYGSMTIVKWQKQNWNSSLWEDITNTSTTHNYTNVTESYNYRVVLDDGTCNNNYSTIASVEVFINQLPTGHITGPQVVSDSDQTILLDLHSEGTITSSTLYTSYYSTMLNGYTADQPVICGSCTDQYDITDIDSDRIFWAEMQTSQGVEITPPFMVKYDTLDTSLIQGNYVKSMVILKDHTDESTISSLDTSELRISYQYVDGMGRGTQSVVKDISPSGNDMVSFTEYDSYGRPEKAYLPFTATGMDYYTDPASLQGTFYSSTADIATDANPYAQTKYETSPYGRVLEQGAPGAAWQLGSGHTPTFSYRFNTGSEVLNWKADGTCTGYYPAGTMYVNELTDENGNKVITYSDLEGKQILKKTQADSIEWLSTQNIYDDYGKLIYVLAPKFNEEISKGTQQLDNNYTLVMGEWTITDQNYSGGSYYYMPGATIYVDPDFLSTNDFEIDVYPGSAIDMDFISDLVFCYVYDDQGRVIEKKVPGSAPTYYAYDMYDQLLLTQDGNTRKNNQWAFVKYDDRGRPTYSGLYTDNTNTTRSAMQAILDTIDYTNGAERFEKASDDTHGYTNVVFPTQNTEILTINYYDDYNFDRSGGDDYNYDASHLTGSTTISELEPYTRGLATSSKTKILGSNDWLQTVIFYDNDGRAVQTLSNNHLRLSLEDITTSIYDSLGRVEKVKSTQTTGPSQSLEVTNRYAYDHTGRVTALYQQNGTDSEVTLASYSYNELGQLIEKQLHSQDQGSSYLQSVEFAYNIRGWLKSINDPDNLQDDQYWGLELYYEDNLNGQQTAYNGNITAAKWGSNAAGTTETKGYGYTYDKMDRLTAASYGEGSTLNQNTGTFNVNIPGYDANGNITLLNRAAADSVGSSVIDQLTFAYTGNQLITVDDAETSAGFSDGTNTDDDYSYDDLGNLTADQNKGIDLIIYNVINKVDSIHFSDGRSISYIYSASGQKLSMNNYLNNTLLKTTDYVGNALYEDQSLKLFGTSEGRVVIDESTGSPVNEYEYALSDHTGNTRVVFSSSPDESTYKAQFESSTYTQDTTYFYNIGTRHDHPAAANTGKAIRLNSANPVGAGISIPVYPGDTLTLSVEAYYEDGSGHGTSGIDLAAMTTAVVNAFGGMNTGTEAQQLIHDIFSEEVGAGLIAGGSGNDAVPSAYLNYFVFDKDFKLIENKSGFIGVQSGEDVEQTLSLADLNIEEVGYLYAYLSNESNSTNFVYFDKFSVTHKEGAVNQYSEYYPFGLKTEQSWERVWTKPNKYLFNGGGFLNEETANYETFFRPYDPAIGRFTGVDPLASSFTSVTPYNYAFNDPIGLNDPNGDAPNWGEPFGEERRWGGSSSRSYGDRVQGLHNGYNHSWTGRGSGKHWGDFVATATENAPFMHARTLGNFYDVSNMSQQQKFNFALGLSSTATKEDLAEPYDYLIVTLNQNSSTGPGLVAVPGKPNIALYTDPQIIGGVLDYYFNKFGQSSDILNPDYLGHMETQNASLFPEVFSRGNALLNLASTIVGAGELGLEYVRRYKNGRGPKEVARIISLLKKTRVGTQQVANTLKTYANGAKNLGSKLGNIGVVVSTFDYIANFQEKNGYDHLNYWNSLLVFAIAGINPVTAGIAVTYGVGQLLSYQYNGKTLEENIGTKFGF